jgi:hypothetical protein
MIIPKFNELNIGERYYWIEQKQKLQQKALY